MQAREITILQWLLSIIYVWQAMSKLFGKPIQACEIFIRLHAYSPQRETLTRTILEMVGTKDSHFRGVLLEDMGYIHQARDEYNQSRQDFSEAASLYEIAGDCAGIGWSELGQGIALRMTSRLPEALDLFHEAEKIRIHW